MIHKCIKTCPFLFTVQTVIHTFKRQNAFLWQRKYLLSSCRPPGPVIICETLCQFVWTSCKNRYLHAHIWCLVIHCCHYTEVIMSATASQIISLTIVYSTVYSGADQRKYKRTAPLAFVQGIHRWSVNSPHKRPVTRKMFPFNDVIVLIKCVSIPTFTFRTCFTHSE